MLAFVALYRLWLENKNLTDRLEAKSDKHAEKNQEVAMRVTEAFESAVRNAERAGPRRRATKTDDNG